jgi:hypothetical protein
MWMPLRWRQNSEGSAYLLKCKHEISDIHSNRPPSTLDTFFKKGEEKSISVVGGMETVAH